MVRAVTPLLAFWGSGVHDNYDTNERHLVFKASHCLQLYGRGLKKKNYEKKNTDRHCHCMLFCTPENLVQLNTTNRPKSFNTCHRYKCLFGVMVRAVTPLLAFWGSGVHDNYDTNERHLVFKASHCLQLYGRGLKKKNYEKKNTDRHCHCMLFCTPENLVHVRLDRTWVQTLRKVLIFAKFIRKI